MCGHLREWVALKEKLIGVHFPPYKIGPNSTEAGVILLIILWVVSSKHQPCFLLLVSLKCSGVKQAIASSRFTPFFCFVSPILYFKRSVNNFGETGGNLLYVHVRHLLILSFSKTRVLTHRPEHCYNYHSESLLLVLLYLGCSGFY